VLGISQPRPISPPGQSAKVHKEVLIRLPNANHELIPPGAFFPAAERHDSITLPDRRVIKHVFQTIRAERDLYLEDPGSAAQPFLYAINLSGASFNDDG
jgi:EAL domain-containing protein (putative c-di-GMP-specific phosphodiesterase class I)